MLVVYDEVVIGPGAAHRKMRSQPPAIGLEHARVAKSAWASGFDSCRPMRPRQPRLHCPRRAKYVILTLAERMECPHCSTHFHDKWQYRQFSYDKEGVWGVGSTTCAACNRIVVSLGKMNQVAEPRPPHYVPDVPSFTVVYPKAIFRFPIPPEVPPEFTKDYREACVVLPGQ